MKTLAEKVAYIRGLMDGLNPKDDDTVKIIKAMVDVLEDMADAIDEIDDVVNDLDEYIGEIDDDLEAVEDYLCEDECDDCDDCDDCDCCDCCEEDEYYTIICPKCTEEFCVDSDIIEEGKINCPNCGEELEFDLSDEDADEE